MEKYYVQFTSHKINPDTGEPYKWRHGPYEYTDAVEHAFMMDEIHGRMAVTTVVPKYGK